MLDVDDEENSQLSPNGQFVAWLSAKPTTFHLWDIAQEKKIVRYLGDVDECDAVFSPGSAFVAFRWVRQFTRAALQCWRRQLEKK